MLARIARIKRAEIAWRTRASARIAWDRFQASRSTPAWHRGDLATALDPALDTVHRALRREDWHAAHRELAERFMSAPHRFAIAPLSRSTLVATIMRRFPAARANAVARADNIVEGRYDLLGYRGLTFDSSGSDAHAIDWHSDPVNGRRAPNRFWSQVPYLDPAIGDHKVIWELNRHQHWLALGRAYWLTRDAKYRERCVFEFTSWLRANPPLIGINWASMLELGLRSLSWLWGMAFLAEGAGDDESPWIVDMLLAIDRQLTQIERNLSYYFSPNTHLLGEALALYVAGRSLPELRQSAGREALGRRILIAESHRQIGSDGGHCERSTHYHRYTLDFYLLALVIARITDDEAAPEFAHAVSRLADAARLLADDRGRLPHLGDDDGGALFPIGGRAPDDVRDSLSVAAALLSSPELLVDAPPEEAYWLLAHPRLSPELARSQTAAVQARRSGALAGTGYYVSRSARGDHLVVDGGAHGYLNGGHAHADALSVTLTVAGVPLLVDPGTGSYTMDGVLRDRLRSSQMHNTLTVDGRSQSTTRGPFSWKSTANGRVREWRTHDAFDYFEGEHDGYRPLEHRRHVMMLRGDMLVVADLVRGNGAHTAAVHWHVDPRWTVRSGKRVVTLSTEGACCQLVVPNGHIERFTADRETGLGWHAPLYGHLEPLTSLRVTRRGEFPFWMASIFGLSPDNPIEDAEFLPVASDSGAIEHALALRVVRRASTDLVLIAQPAHDRATCRFDQFETDARVLFCRLAGQRLADVVLMDGSFVRKLAEPGSQFELPHRLAGMHVDLRHLRGAVPVEA